jgi:RND family efflux transporter MFP subunit
MRYRSLLVAGLIVPTFLFTGCKKEEAKPEIIRPVTAIKIAGDAGFAGRSFPGRAQATTELNLGFEVAGTIIARPVNKGDKVKRGQILARLDPRDFKNELAAAAAQRDRDRAYRDRIAEALQAGAVSKQDLTDADARLDQSTAMVRIKRKALEDSNIRAPFDGVVSWTYKEKNQRVQAKELVLRVLDISKMEFTVSVPETLISQAPYVKDVVITFDAFPNRPIPAKVKEIGTEASATTRTYPVTLIFDQPADISILSGMAGVARASDVEMPGEAEESEFEIPVSALFTPDKEKSFVWVIDESTMTVKKREVMPRRLTARGQRVRGLEPGIWIATAGVHTLREGQKVKIMEAGTMEIRGQKKE